ncbi:MAG: AEC family transporter [Beijerinckiaceae bacterium]
MVATFLIVLPVFIIIAAGYAASATGLLRDRVADGLSDFVFVIAIPVLLFRTMATAALPEVQPWFYWIAYFSSLGIVWLVTTLVARRFFGVSGQELPIAGFTAAQSNTVFVGIPLILRAFGDAAAVPLFLLIAIHLPITMTVATLLVEKSDTRGNDWGGMLKKLAAHPILLGIFLGLLYRLTGLPLTGPFATASKLVADAAAPTALFALGMTLFRYGLNAPLALVSAIAGLKLMLFPALVYVMAFHVLPMPPVWAAVAVVFAACPSGVNAYLLAQRYQTALALSSSVIALTTLLGVFTTTFWVWIVTGMP